MFLPEILLPLVFSRPSARRCPTARVPWTSPSLQNYPLKKAPALTPNFASSPAAKRISLAMPHLRRQASLQTTSGVLQTRGGSEPLPGPPIFRNRLPGLQIGVLASAPRTGTIPGTAPRSRRTRPWGKLQVESCKCPEPFFFANGYFRAACRPTLVVLRAGSSLAQRTLPHVTRFIPGVNSRQHSRRRGARSVGSRAAAALHLRSTRPRPLRYGTAPYPHTESLPIATQNGIWSACPGVAPCVELAGAGQSMFGSWHRQTGGSVCVAVCKAIHLRALALGGRVGLCVSRLQSNPSSGTGG